MKHPLACVLAVITAVLFTGTGSVLGQFSNVVVNGIKIKRVGCFKENTGKRNIPVLLFSDIKGFKSTTKVDYGKNFGPYIAGVIKRCATAAQAKSYLFFAVNNIGECYSGKGVSTTYAAKGSSKNCKNSGGTKCAGTTQDCVGGNAKSNYVYKLERLSTAKPTTKATTKPGGATAKRTGAAAKLSALSCQNYLVAVKASAGSAGKPQVPTPAGASPKPTAAGKSTAPTVATPTTSNTPSPQSSIEKKVKSIYKGYSCLACLKTVNASSSTVFLMLQFTCQGQHLKKLVAGLGANNIIKAECYPPACAGSMYPCPSPCGMSTCSMSPSLPYPSVCQTGMPYPPAPIPYPAPVPPPQCPMPCLSRCAPACSSFCCRSMIGYKNKIGISAKKSATLKADDFDDDDNDDDDVDDDDDDDNDDTDFDETS